MTNAEPRFLADLHPADAAEWVERIVEAVDPLPATNVLRALGLDPDEADVRDAQRAFEARNDYIETGRDYAAGVQDALAREHIASILRPNGEAS